MVPCDKSPLTFFTTTKRTRFFRKRPLNPNLIVFTNFPGSVGITLNHSPGVPKNPTSLSDIMATEVYNQFGLGWFAEPIFGSGDYPDVMRWQVGNKSLEQGYSESRLPEFTDVEKKMLKGMEPVNVFVKNLCVSTNELVSRTKKVCLCC